MQRPGRSDTKAATAGDLTETAGDLTASAGDLTASAGEKSSPPDLSVWLIWGFIMLVAFAALPFVVRGQELFRTLAVMCGFDIG